MRNDIKRFIDKRVKEEGLTKERLQASESLMKEMTAKLTHDVKVDMREAHNGNDFAKQVKEAVKTYLGLLRGDVDKQ